MNPVLNEPDSPFDLALRPADFSDFHGQTKVKEQLLVMVEAAKLREESLDHVLLCGPPGLGKTTLANLIAKLLAEILFPTVVTVDGLWWTNATTSIRCTRH